MVHSTALREANVEHCTYSTACTIDNASLELAEFYKSINQHILVRNDYKELIQLSLLYVDCTNDSNTTTIQRPGALSRARWMCKILYTLKTVLLSERSKEPPMFAFLNYDVLCKLKRFANFCVKIYIPW